MLNLGSFQLPLSGSRDAFVGAESLFHATCFQLPLSGSQNECSANRRAEEALNFQLPLSGSLADYPIHVPGDHTFQILSTPSLGITLHHPDITPFSFSAILFQLPLSGSRSQEVWTETARLAPRRTFNSLSRDHSISSVEALIPAPSRMRLSTPSLGITHDPGRYSRFVPHLSTPSLGITGRSLLCGG